VTFAKLAYAQRVLRAAAGQAMVKEALLGTLGRAAMGVGKAVWNQGVKHNGMMAPLALGLGIPAVAASVKGGIDKSKAYGAGFNPAVQAYQSTPIG
jgi:hypothetical protein